MDVSIECQKERDCTLQGHTCPNEADLSAAQEKSRQTLTSKKAESEQIWNSKLLVITVSDHQPCSQMSLISSFYRLLKFPILSNSMYQTAE